MGSSAALSVKLVQVFAETISETSHIFTGEIKRTLDLVVHFVGGGRISCQASC
jgi:hypothetical protein